MSARQAVAVPPHLRGRRVTLRARGCSGRVDVRWLGVLAALLAAMAAALIANVAVGEVAIAPADVVLTLVGAGDAANDFIVVDLRLPRALTALLAGAALGLAGAVFQLVTRNPLASPDVVGVADGASFAAVAVIVLGSATGALAVPAAALGGALAAGVILYALAWRGGVQGHRLVLVGIAVAAFAEAGVSYVLTRGRIFEVSDAYVWLVGTVNGRGWEHVWPLAAALAVLLPWSLMLARRVDALSLGDEVARALGVGVERARLALLTLAVVLTAAAVAATGPIHFVAFIAPHLARRLGRSAAALGVLPAAAACGAVLVLVADLAGRLIFAPTEMPVGLITSIVAAPYFLLLLRRATRIGAEG